MANEAEIVDVLKTGTMMKLDVVDLAKMSFSEQLALVRSSNVLVGIHGAGLMFIMFAAEEVRLLWVGDGFRDFQELQPLVVSACGLFLMNFRPCSAGGKLCDLLHAGGLGRDSPVVSPRPSFPPCRTDDWQAVSSSSLVTTRNLSRHE